jgi:hypothetical protein
MSLLEENFHSELLAASAMSCAAQSKRWDVVLYMRKKLHALPSKSGKSTTIIDHWGKSRGVSLVELEGFLTTAELKLRATPTSGVA